MPLRTLSSTSAALDAGGRPDPYNINKPAPIALTWRAGANADFDWLGLGANFGITSVPILFLTGKPYAYETTLSHGSIAGSVS
jgi:hypothetical protein